jgi:SAM-dependent methyltransferase
MATLRARENLAERTAEAWRPPQFKPPGGRLAAVLAGVRRFFDLQAGSIWRDVAAELPSCRGVVLDVGCGAQPHRPLVHRDAEYIPIDTADAKEHFGYEVPNTRYFSGDRWPVEDSSVDLVLCTEVLEHVLEPRRLLDEARRCLRPGGWLLLTVPFVARWHFIPHDYWRYTPSSLKYLLTSAGFENIAVYARGNAVTVASYKGMALLLPLLLPQHGNRCLRLGKSLLFAVPLAPIMIALACIAHLSLRGRGGDDCLGYTALAQRTR